MLNYVLFWADPIACSQLFVNFLFHRIQSYHICVLIHCIFGAHQDCQEATQTNPASSRRQDYDTQLLQSIQASHELRLRRRARGRDLCRSSGILLPQGSRV